MNVYAIWLLMWQMWLGAPGCGGSCNQGRADCDCSRREGGQA